MNAASEQHVEASREVYSGVGSEAVLRHLSSRTAEKQAAFFLPHLRAGMELLDCGCGLGTITVGLARAVSPGGAVGIDFDDGQIARAQNRADVQQLANLRFETANVYALPFADNSFDALFSNALLTHLADPIAALAEIHRVLKPGGVAGIRNPTEEGGFMTPKDPLLERSLAILRELFRRNGGNPNLGLEQRALLRQVGFVKVEASASFDSGGTPESASLWAETMAGFFGEEKGSSQIIGYGLADRAELESMRQAWAKWAENPDAFSAGACIEVLGWKA